MVGEVENEKAGNNTNNCGSQMIASKEKKVNLVKNHPNASPNKYNTHNNAKVFGKVAKRMVLLEVAHYIDVQSV